MLDITLAGLFWALAGEEDVIARLIKKTLYIGFFAFLIGNFNRLAKIIFDSFSGLGLKAAGSGLSAADFLRPGRIAQVCLDAGKPILEAAGQLMGYVSFFENFVQITVLLITWAIAVISFFILAVQLFITLIEFKLTALAGFVLVPFGLFNKTSFLAEKVLGNVVASGVKILVLTVIIGIGTSLFSQFTQGFGGNQPTIEDALSLVLAALSLLGLGIFGPGIATALVSGAPQLGAGAAVGTGLAAAGIGAAGVIGARAGAGALVGATSFAARGGAAMTGGAATAYGLAAASSGETGLRRASAGMAGIAKAGISAAAQISRGGASDGPPDWAQRVRRDQTLSRGISSAARFSSPGRSLMTPFRRPSVRYGKTPEPEAPYQMAAQVWDDRIGSARVQARNWRLIAFGNLALAAGRPG